MAKQRVVVVGGGLAGLAATMKLAEDGIPVDLVSMVPVKRSHSVCAQGGINSCNKFTRAQGDSEWKHFDDTVYGGEFLNNQPLCLEMAYWAPRVIHLLERIGVPFNRSPEGQLAVRRFGGTLYKRTVYAGASTGQQLLYGLDEQVRRFEAEGKVQKYEFWEFLGPVLDGNGVCRGVVIQDMFSLEIKALPADAVVMATGGCGLIFGKSTMSMVCTGGANARVYKAGAVYANGEFVQVHPSAIPGADKLRLISESARGEGGRVWVPRDPGDARRPMQIPESERLYFLEEKYPTYGNLVPRDIATREIFAICKEGRSVDPNTYCVYLDLTERATGIKREVLEHKLGAILEIYEKFVGVDPLSEPMKIFPAVHYSMGGIWVDFERDERTGGLVAGSPRNQQTSIPGLFAVGECDYQYHGANRLGANSLLSCIFSGLFVGPCVESWLRNLPHGSVDAQPTSLFDAEVRRHGDACKALIARDGDENPYELHRELGDLMTRNVTVVRDNRELRETLDTLEDLSRREQRAALSDKGEWTNQNLSFTRALRDMIDLAKVITKGALLRDECRGAHYKPEFEIPAPNSDDPAELESQARQWCQRYYEQAQNWLKTTLARYSPEGPEITYEPVDTGRIPPRPRTYGVRGAEVIERVWKESFHERAVAEFCKRTTEPASA
ncbi:MAG: succinate dehydrogenase flavoprotein subunit [Planctomycetota bacterium]|nr:MAG: succinate dehydrogenase flavoprotein subunit [Planctomycetota bacterium]